MKDRKVFVKIRKLVFRIRLYLIISLVIPLSLSCSRYHPKLLVKFTTGGEAISVKRLVKGAYPSWSPDGRYLAFQNGGIYIVDIETKRQNKISPAGANPSWSPDGNKIAYGNDGIWIWDRGSGRRVQISKQGNYPCWYPDGQSLAFNHKGIWQMDTKGNIMAKLLDTGSPLSFSPDTTMLLIEVWMEDFVSFNLEILDLSNFTLRGMAEGTRGSFSPDGLHIIYSKEGIWLYSIEKKDSKRLTMDGYDPRWSPTGGQIAFCYKDYIWLMESP